MALSFVKNTVLIILFLFFSCGSQTSQTNKLVSDGLMVETNLENPLNLPRTEVNRQDKTKKGVVETGELNVVNQIITGAESPQQYLPLLTGKNVGVVANQTSFLENENIHLIDFLISKNISVKVVFSPEHGFRGKADAGEHIKDAIDTKTGVPIVSLYGDNKKPKLEQLAGSKKIEEDIQKGVSTIEVMVFDLQDVGARFYTYIATLHYVMEACAEARIPVIILDRPNPNGHYVDGPIMEPENQSFVGMNPVPVVHGMTIGEYAQMLNGEGWLKNKVKCDLTVIKMQNYTHQTPYSLPIKPSPNLPNNQAINLYPSLCFFEGTFISAGRGTDMQFQVFGAPSLPASKYTFEYTPQSNEGAKSPKFKGQLCHGKDLRKEPRLSKINLEWLIDAYNANGKKSDFFNSFFVKLAGTKKLQQQIEQGLSAKEIRDSWKDGLAGFQKIREKYLIYP